MAITKKFVDLTVSGVIRLFRVFGYEVFVIIQKIPGINPVLTAITAPLEKKVEEVIHAVPAEMPVIEVPAIVVPVIPDPARPRVIDIIQKSPNPVPVPSPEVVVPAPIEKEPEVTRRPVLDRLFPNRRRR